MLSVRKQRGRVGLRLWLPFALLLMGVLSCREPFGLERDTSAAIQTRALEYTLRPELNAVLLILNYTFENPTDRPVFVMLCDDEPDLRLERLTDGVWIEVDLAGRTCRGEGLEVGPGEVWRDQMRIFGGLPSCGCLPQFANSQPEGIFRIVIDDILETRDPVATGGTRLPLENRVSNPFKIKVP